ncbi:MAG: DUF4358 domain-containing protein [Subdoligranulum sp.]|nr:DUF4358 domain-containing protein [Subdoligranulum sp.]
MKASIRISALLLALCLALAGCSAPASTGDGAADNAGDRASPGQSYAFAIRDARDAADNESSAIASGDAGAEPFFSVNPNDLTSEESAGQISMMMQILGLDAASLDAYAFSVSLMNVRAYAIGVFKPAEGKADDVTAALEEYISLQQQSFEQYLEDQYAIAKDALLRTLPGGEIVLVMCENAPDVMAKLEKALA